MWASGAEADAIIEAKGLRQITDTAAIERVIDEVMAKNPAQLADYRVGQGQAFRLFRRPGHEGHGGKANPAELNKLLKTKLAG